MPDPVLAATRKQIKTLYDRYAAENILLPKPPFADSVFEGMVFQSDVALVMDRLLSEEEREERRKQRNREHAAAWREKARKALGVKKREPAARVSRENHPCWCGMCDMLVPWDALYAGADHYAGIMRKFVAVERGLEKREDLPKFWLDKLKWRKCPQCHGWTPTTDLRGKAREGLGFYCLRSERHRKRGWRRDNVNVN